MNPFDFRLDYDLRGQLVLCSADDAEPVPIEPVRLFPISDPERWIVLCDRHGRELVSIEEPAALPAEMRNLLEEELRRRQFFPVIERIVRTRGEMTGIQWHVETDRGPAAFFLNSEDDVRPLGAHRALVIDADGVRYHIPDARKLDSASRRALERYL